MKNNRQMFFGLLTVIILVQLCISSVAAESLDLQTAITHGLTQNRDLQTSNLNRERTLLELDKQKAANLSTQSRYAELEAAYNLLNAENTYNNAVNQVITTITQQFTEVYLAEMDIIIKQKRADLEKINLSEITTQFELGYASELEKLDQDNIYNNANFNLEIAQNTFQRRLQQLANTLGLTNEKQNLTIEKLPQPQIWDITEADFLAASTANSTELQLADMNYELAVIDLERSGITASELDLKIKQLGLEIAELNLIQTKENIVDGFSDNYNNFSETVKRLQLQSEMLTKTEANHEIILAQRELGLVTDKDILQSELSLLDAQYQYEQIVVSYYTNEIILKQAIGETDWRYQDDYYQK